MSDRPASVPAMLPAPLREQLRENALEGFAKGRVPEHLHDGLLRYIVDGIPTGSFLEAVLCNDLRDACARADLECRHSLFDIVDFLWNYAPAGSWGSEENVKRWTGMAELRSR